MDTTKLVVGQDVYVVSNSGKDFLRGKVTKVTPEGVEVVCDEPLSKTGIGFSGDLPDLRDPRQRDSFVDSLVAVPMRFDSEGNNGTDGWEGMNVWGFDWYPWHIDDMPFEERRKGQV